jgi:hypothetical protein
MRRTPAASHWQPKESAPSLWLHFVLTSPVVEQPELSFMQVQSEEAAEDAQAAGTFLQLPAIQVPAVESKVRPQYSPAAQVAVPHWAVAGVDVVPAAGHSPAKLAELLISLQLLFSRHVICSALGLASQTPAEQLLLATPQVESLLSQRLWQSAAASGVAPAPPDVPDPELEDEHAARTTSAEATAATVNEEREARSNVMAGSLEESARSVT